MFKKLVAILISFSLMSTAAFASGNEGIRKKAMKKEVKTMKKMAMKNKMLKIDLAKSKLKWTGTKLMGSHYGYMGISKGVLKMHNGHLVGGSFVVDMENLTVTDGLKGKKLNDLIGHLKGTDFFNTKEHKTAKLVIKDSSMAKGGAFDVTADLTIKGITKPVAFQVTLKEKGKTIYASTKLVFNRLNYGIRYNSGKYFPNIGDRLIHDDVTLDIDLVAAK